MDKFESNAVCQVGIIVRNIEEKAASYARLFGMKVPDIVVTDPEEQAQTKYYGKPSKARAKLAFFQMGDVQLELIEPDSEPSTWREFLDKHGEGIHHIALTIKGMSETVQFLGDNGAPLIQKGEYTGGRYAYIDSTSQLGLILELLEND